MVLGFHLSVIILWVLSVRWVYFKGGAEFIERHPGLFQKHGFGGRSNINANQVKTALPVILLGGVFAMVMMWIVQFPLPNI